VVALTDLATKGSLTWVDVALGLAAAALGSPALTARSSLIALRRFRLVSAVDMVTAFLVLGAVSIGSVVGTPRAVLAAIVVSTLSSLAVWAWMAMVQLHRAGSTSWWQSRTGDLGEERRSVIRFLVATDGTASLSTVVREVDVLVVGSVVGTAGAGVYRLALSAVAPIGALVAALQSALYPRLAASADALRHIRSRSQLVLGGAALGVAVLVAGLTLAPFGVRVVGGSEFSDAVGPARWALAGGSVVLALFWVRPALLASGQARYLLFNSCVVAVASVIGFYVGAEAAGVAGVAAARAAVTSVAGSLTAGVHFLRWQRRHGADDEAGHLVGSAEAAVDPP
jgi:O-antigen/teichoic acid export membrane protein